MNFEQFIHSTWHNYWLKEGKLTLYVRRTPERFRHKWGDFQLASMGNPNMGRGDLTRFLNKWEREYQFYVENVFNERLQQYLILRGYKIVNEELCLAAEPPCFLGPDPKLINDLHKIIINYHNGEENE